MHVARWILGISLIAAACSPATPTGGTQPGQPTASGPSLGDNASMTVGISFIAATMDPHISTTGTARRHEIFETLVILDNNGKAQPLLATEWRSVDATTWRFSLRKDAKFQNNTPVTADDVAFSWKRITDGKLRTGLAGFFPSVSDIVVVDPNTVDVKAKQPDPLLVQRLHYLAILPKAYVEQVGDTEFGIKPIGSGPYKLKEFRPDDRIVVSAWNEHPYRKPIVQEFTVRAIADNNARLQGLRTGELDVAYLLTNDQVEVIKREGLTFATTAPASVSGGFLDPIGGNGIDPGAMADKRVRQAINYAVDRDAVAKSIYAGVQQPTSLMILPGSVGANPDIRPYTYDMAKAKQLLSEAGYPNGFRTTIGLSPTAPEAQPLALYLQSQFKQLGIEAEIERYEAAIFTQALIKQRAIAPILLGSNGTGPYYDADSFLTYFWSKNRSFGQRYNNPEFDRLYEASQNELDTAKRETLLKQATAILADDPPWVSFTTIQGIGAARPNVAGEWMRLDVWPLVDTVYRTK